MTNSPSNPQPMSILLFIGTMQTGGAERQMGLLAHELSLKGHQMTIVTFFPGGQFWDWLLQQKSGVRLIALFRERSASSLKRKAALLSSPFRLRRIIKQNAVDVVYSVLNTTNVIARLATFALPKIAMACGIRNSDMPMNWKEDISFRFCSLMSPSVPLMISNSHDGLAFHIRRGYKAKKQVVVPNGFDCERFRPDPDDREEIRREWKINDDEILIGLVGRLDPLKDHDTFLSAAAQLKERIDKVRFVCVGSGTDDYEKKLRQTATRLGLDDCLIWAGNRTDIKKINNGLDISVNSSVMEGFPNVVGEAMACGTPCVVTDVGDSALLVGDTGVVVPRRDPEAFSQGVMDLLEKDRKSMSTGARERITSLYSTENLILETERLLYEIHTESR